MAKKAKHPRLSFLRTGPAQYMNRAGILRKAGDCVAPWGNRALISGGKNALAAAEERLTKSLEKSGITWRKHLFTGESSPSNAAKIKGKAQDFKANIIIGGGCRTRPPGSLHPDHRRHLRGDHGVVSYLQ